MEADDFNFDSCPYPLAKMEKTDLILEKMVHKDFYNDFGDIFDVDAE
jgi:hypothetical protein